MSYAGVQRRQFGSSRKFSNDPLSHEADMSASHFAPRALTLFLGSGLLVCGLMTAGCRSGGNQELIERELRFQENELYRLHDELDAAHAQVEAAQRENDALKKELSTGDPGAAPTSPVRSRPSVEPKALPMPTIELPPGIDGPSAPPLPPPSARNEAPPSQFYKRGSRESANVDMPISEGRPLERQQGEDITPAEPALPEFSAPEELPPPGSARRRTKVHGASHEEPTGEDRRATKIVLNKQMTGGRNADGRQGSEALTVMFEPRNGAGQLVQTNGDVSIVVLDPAENGAAARVARWDFNPDEARAHYRSAGQFRGYHFELPWPGKAPQHGTLELFVRLKTADGQRLVTDQTIQIDPPGEPQRQTWTAAERTAAAHNAAHATAAGAEEQVAVGNGERPRFFSRLRPSGGSGSADAKTDMTPAEAPGAMDITVQGAGGDRQAGGENGTAPGGGGRTPRTARLIERSRLRGGPGIVDGSRIGLKPAGRDGKKTGGDKGGPASAQSGGEAPRFNGDAPTVQPGSTGGFGGEAPPYRSQGPATPLLEVPEPMGGPPLGDPDAPQNDPPTDPRSASRSSRPVWRPNR
jgi:hypothetical protein